MRSLALFVLSGLLVASRLTGVSAAAEADASPLTVNITAVQASSEGRTQKQFGPGLESVRGVLEDNAHDTFQPVQAVTREMRPGAETLIPIDQTYSLRLTPLGREPDGRVRLEARVEMQPPPGRGGAPRNAVKTTALVAPGRSVLFRGLTRGQGELLIVLGVQGDARTPYRGTPPPHEVGTRRDATPRSETRRQSAPHQPVATEASPTPPRRAIVREGPGVQAPARSYERTPAAPPRKEGNR